MPGDYDGMVFRVGEGRDAIVEPVGSGWVRFLEILCRGICKLGERGEDFFVGFFFEAGPFLGVFRRLCSWIVGQVELSEGFLVEEVEGRNPAGAEKEDIAGDVLSAF